MFKRSTLPRWISLLAALWLVGQLAAAFHLGHTEPEGVTGSEHSCLLCKVAAADDVIASAPSHFVVSVFFFIAALALVLLARRQAQWRYRARAPPAI